MDLEHLFDLRLQYRTPLVVQLAWNGQGQGLGRGDGTATGRLSGSVEWVNTPPVRADAVFQPTVTGAITTEAGDTVLYQTHGLSLRPAEDEPDHRRFSTAVRFTTDADPYRWLNDVLAVEEGVIDIRDGSITTRVFATRHTVGPDGPAT